MTLLAVERIKLLSIRSPWWCLATAIVVSVALAGLIANFAEPEMLSIGLTQTTSQFGLILVMATAALSITTEYRFGTIRATFQAAPDRGAVLLAKSVVIAALTGAAGLVTAFGSWGLAVLLSPEAQLAVTEPGQWRTIAGTGLVYALAGVFALAVATLVRQPAAATTAVLMWPLALESLIPLIPRVGPAVEPWLPFYAANHFLFGELDDAAVSVNAAGVLSNGDMPFGPWGALAWFAGVAAVLLAAAVIVTKRRDA
ncbi:ABC-2 type transport system permease protein [Actinoalloteichus hoggarensis]|uniref:ABC-2 family transporter protein n=1 Tax=Actinoalloteichus hoggarensis TaxID=1470176 RepID=A0A221WAE7_9PSEU|nr:ABC-2 family transporter protein [Actinoalloteichus hoggarensis]MBB5922663.1 ABC-2 type transport system permease protein [Actinoalloteichus hoggarensis]